MPPATEQVVSLRRLIEGRFPAAPARERRVVPTGVPGLDACLGGGLPAGALTELVADVPSAGCQSALGSLLHATRGARQRVALVDAAGCFDPNGLDDDTLAHLVWIRCGSLADTWRSADLVARDPNYAVVLIDVRGLSLRELQRTRDAVWVRLQRAAEQAGTACIIQSDALVVPNAACRVVFDQPLAADALTQPRAELLIALNPGLQRRRTAYPGRAACLEAAAS
jgi:hypothetical protein